jgi:hypothetical protein
VAIGELADEILEVVLLGGLSELDGDAEGERVAAGTGEVFAEQVGSSSGVAAGRGPDHFDVVAFPVHRSAS